MTEPRNTLNIQRRTPSAGAGEDAEVAGNRARDDKAEPSRTRLAAAQRKLGLVSGAVVLRCLGLLGVWARHVS